MYSYKHKKKWGPSRKFGEQEEVKKFMVITPRETQKQLTDEGVHHGGGPIKG